MKIVKHLRYPIFLMIIIVLILELCPYIISPIISNKSFSRKQLKKELQQEYQETANLQSDKKNENRKDEYLGGSVLHPYLGFVSIPFTGSNRFGFHGTDPITQESSDTVNICLMGGSVALGLFGTSKNKIIENLKHSKYFKGKEFNIIQFCLGGYKQPQQLIALNYFLSLGAHYDIVINLDGFNEIVLPFVDNLPFNVFPSYPRNWNIYSRKSFDNRVQLVLSKQLILEIEQNNLNKFFVETPLFYSNFGLLLWNVLSNNNKTAQFQVEQELREAVSQSESDYQSTGPQITFSDTTQFFMEQVELWQRSSILINALGESMGFEYFHFLQPNQYYKNSKTLTEDEQEFAYEQGRHPYKIAAQTGYPILVNYGKGLIEKGVNYYDLTLMFKNEKRTVYNDKCCHFNEMGYNMIADKISGYIVNYFDNKEESVIKQPPNGH
ncbi:MAG: hypothetical protein K8S00_02450 [Bacteroidales bacterium]|nr:hypothetical protein [Bacteroidales bacterium]